MRKGPSLALLAMLAVIPASARAFTRPAGTARPVGDTVVPISGFTFSPTGLTVAPGTTVCWTNPDGGILHTVTADDGTSFDSGGILAGQIYEHTFAVTGDYPYHCIYHGGAGGV